MKPVIYVVMVAAISMSIPTTNLVKVLKHLIF